MRQRQTRETNHDKTLNFERLCVPISGLEKKQFSPQTDDLSSDEGGDMSGPSMIYMTDIQDWVIAKYYGLRQDGTVVRTPDRYTRLAHLARLTSSE